MAFTMTAGITRFLHGIALLQTDAELSDGQLLERYIRQRDEGAFAALVRRHGPMVWGVWMSRLVTHPLLKPKVSLRLARWQREPSRPKSPF